MTRIEDLEFHVLVCLAAARDWKHGYVVRQWLEERHGAAVAFQSIYRVISRLHERGLVELQETTFAESYAGIPRKNYRLSAAGWQYIAARAEEVRTQLVFIDRSLKEYERVLAHAQNKQTQSG